MKLLGEKTFDDLKIPCAVTAVDVKTGSEVVISEGYLRDAVLATIALPGIFPPHHLNDWELMDGGVLNPVPVSVARMLSPDLPIVAVVLNDPLDIPVRTYTIPVPPFFRSRSQIEYFARMWRRLLISSCAQWISAAAQWHIIALKQMRLMLSSAQMCITLICLIRLL